MVQRLGNSYGGILTDHHRLIRAGLAAHDGREVDTQGDAFFAVFSSASQCVAAAVEIQRSLATHTWQKGQRVRVRMGIHSGEATETTVGLIGLDVHRGARVAAVAHGGQVLCSASTACLIEYSMPEGVLLKDLGAHRLKDLGRPEHLFQVEAEGLSREFPPLRSLDNPELPNNLPSSLSTFVGREAETQRHRHARANLSTRHLDRPRRLGQDAPRPARRGGPVRRARTECGSSISPLSRIRLRSPPRSRPHSD